MCLHIPHLPSCLLEADRECTTSSTTSSMLFSCVSGWNLVVGSVERSDCVSEEEERGKAVLVSFLGVCKCN